MSGRILVVEDEDAIASFETTTLERDGFTVQRVRTGREALALLDRSPQDLILLDLILPGELDGLRVCQAIRARTIYVPIIMVTAKDEDVDKIVGLEIGADDYITKPFNTRMLLARVHAVLRLARRGTRTHDPEQIRIGPLTIDLPGREVTVAGRPIPLTPKEFDLLVAFARNPGRVLGRETLMQQVWGYDYLGDSRTVDVHVQRLRSKLEPDSGQPRYLVTVRGIGYKFALDEEG